MEPSKVILYYCFTPLSDPDAIRLWQKELCENLNLKGRILISKHGINGTVGGDMSSVIAYVKQTRKYLPFKKIDFKWSEGTGDDFPRLMIKVRDEVVSFGAPDELVVDENGVVGGGIHLKPKQVNQLVEERGDEVVFFDGRNQFEARIGKFKNAIVPEVATTREFVAELESGKYDHLMDRPIVSYCTGGIRCEVLSSVMKNRGFKEVYQMEGGIVRYAEEFGSDGLWEGSLYIFDKRMNQEFGKDPKTLGECDHCSAPTSKFYNCANLACRKLILLCENCKDNNTATNCSPKHADLIYK